MNRYQLVEGCDFMYFGFRILSLLRCVCVCNHICVFMYFVYYVFNFKGWMDWKQAFGRMSGTIRVELVFYDEQGSLTIEQDFILNLVV